jgi:hypothetical protein
MPGSAAIRRAAANSMKIGPTCLMGLAGVRSGWRSETMEIRLPVLQELALLRAQI